MGKGRIKDGEVGEKVGKTIQGGCVILGIGRPLESKSEKQHEAEKSNMFVPSQPKYGIDDLILDRLTREKLLDVATSAQNFRKVFEEWNLQSTHKYSKKVGINLWGAPGTGKTMAAHAIANFLGRKIILVDYADIESKYVGETSKNLRKAFTCAKQSGAILFFDEADAILSKRVTGMEHATDVSVNQTRTEMLLLLNEYDDFIIFATNFIENFDPAFMRRILAHIEFKLPDDECRLKLLNKYIPKEMPNSFDLNKATQISDGLSGSDIANAILNAAFAAARHNVEMVEEKYLDEAIEDIKKSKEANKKSKHREVKIEEVDEKDIPEGIKVMEPSPRL